MALRTVSLDDKYEGREGSVYITGTQALVRARTKACVPVM